MTGHPIAEGVSVMIASVAMIAGGLLGQAGTDPISGGAGWVGAGLLGLVLGWLLILHLPAKDKQVAELIKGNDEFRKWQSDRHAAALDDMTEKHESSRNQERSDFRDSLQQVLSHCAKEQESVSQMVREQMTNLKDAIRELRDAIRQAAASNQGAPGSVNAKG